MATDMSKEAMKLALEALEYIEHNYMSLPAPAEKAITALREALANEALDKMAENARELGLDYETAQQTPVAWVKHTKKKLRFTTMPMNYEDGWRPLVFGDTSPQPQPAPTITPEHLLALAQTASLELDKVIAAFKMAAPVQQEPVACANGCRGFAKYPAQRTWVGLTDEDVRQCSRDVVAGGKENSVDRFAYAIEAKLKEKNA